MDTKELLEGTQTTMAGHANKAQRSLDCKIRDKVILIIPNS
jgi:hypothetical protein